MRNLFASSVLVLLISTGVSSQIYLSGPLNGVLTDTTYIVEDDISVEAGDSLTIDGGAVLRFETSTDLTIEGFFCAEGNAADSILFVKSEPAGSWHGITVQFQQADTIKFKYCRISDSVVHGLYLDHCLTYLIGSTITNNSATDSYAGGGIHAKYSDVIIDSSCISDNYGGYYGGGICAENSNLTITNSVIQDNTASCSQAFCGAGGGVYLEYCDALFDNTQFINNQVITGFFVSEAFGGGVFCKTSTLILAQCIFDGNVATPDDYSEGGGLLASDGSVLQIINTIFRHNLADYRAGAYIIDSTADIIDSEFIENRNDGLYLREGDYFIDGCNFSGNVSGFYANGALKLYHCEFCTIVNCTISENSGSNWAVYIDSSPTEFRTCSIENNENGGIRIEDSNSLIDSCIFIENQCVGYGGGLSLESGEHEVMNSLFTNNHSGSGGGGISKWNSAILWLNNCTFSGNSADQNGSAINLSYDNTEIRNSVFFEHQIASTINLYGAPLFQTAIKYCNFYDNESGNFSGTAIPGIGLPTYTNINGDPCDVYHNIFLEPQFVNPEEGDFRLQWGSPCIDAGHPNSPLDPDSTIADIGAYYFDQLLKVENPAFNQQPTTYNLEPPFPNPFNSTVRITYAVPQAGQVELTLFDITGRTVGTIFNGWKAPGYYDLSYNPEHLASGIYFLRMNTQNFTSTQKIVYLK